MAAVAELQRGAPDDVVLGLAAQRPGVLLTEDRDFGRLIYASEGPGAGVIYMRYPSRMRAELIAAVIRLVREQGEQLTACFVVLQPGRVRISRRP
jgi:hypothetical protein